MQGRGAPGVTAISAAGVSIGVLLVGSGGAQAQAGNDPTGYYVVGAFLIGTFVWVLLLYFVAWPAVQWLDAWRARVIERAKPGSAGGRSFGIHSASFGLSQDHRDVTEQVRAKVDNGRLTFYATVDAFGFDPCPGTEKKLWIKFWDAAGTLNDVEYDERDLVDLPPSRPSAP